MANRYWVGGTASWDGTAGTKWSDTSGGAGGFSVPTSADDVFFTNLSTGTVTIASGNTGAKSINCTGFAGTIAGTAAITVAGSVTLAAGQTYTHTGNVSFTGTGTLTTAGKSFSALSVNGAGITLTLGDALNVGSRDIFVSQGTFTTSASSYNVTAGSISSFLGGGVPRTINLNSSIVTLSAVVCINFVGASVSDLTLSGTYELNAIASSIEFRPGIGLSFHNVSFTSASAGTRTITTPTTFNNLTLAASATGMSQLDLGGDLTINGTLTCAGTSAIQRGFVRSNSTGTARTITAAVISANDCDFRDITIAGGAAGASPTRAGDCGGNSGVTFPAAKTVYRVGTNTSWGGSSSWALTSGGTGSNDNFPLAQDTAVVNNDTTLTLTLSFAPAYNIGTLDASNRTTGITLNFNSVGNFYGSYTLGSGVTVSGTSGQTFLNRGTSTFTSAGKTITFPIIVGGPGGTFQLGGALTSSNSLQLTRGTFNANNYNVTILLFTSSGTNTRTLTMGSGQWTITGTGSIWSVFATNFTLNKDTADILFTNTSTTARGFAGGGLSYNKLTIGGATGTSTLTISDANTFTELASTKTVAHTIRLATSGGTIGAWSVAGSSGNVVTLNSTTTGTRRTFNLSNVTASIDYLAVQDIEVLQANRFYVGANSTNNGNNVNVLFSDSPNALALATGLSTTGAVGTVTVIVPVDVTASVTGRSTTGAVGSTTVTGTGVALVTGLVATGAVGTVTTTGTGLVLPTGLGATGAVGTVVVSTTSNVIALVTGLVATGAVGSVTVVTTGGGVDFSPRLLFRMRRLQPWKRRYRV